MQFQHQPQLSVNSVQSLIEPVTPPLGQMNPKNNHQRTTSLDLSGFNQFISNTSPLNGNSMPPLSTISATAATSATSSVSANSKNRMNSLPLINEFESILPPGGSAAADLSSLTQSQNQNENYPVNSGSMGSSRGSRTRSHSRNTSAANNASSASSISSLASGSVSGEPSVSSATASVAASINDLHSVPLKDLDYVKLSTDQYGCRFLQRKLETPQESDQVRDLIFENVQNFFLDLILDPFGNYLIQKLCDYLTTEQKTAMIKDIYPSVFQISINQYGTRSLQKIIDTVETQEHVDMIIKGFSQEYTSIDQVVTLINDLNGNHVIQKCIFKFQPSNFDFIIDAIVNNDNIITISTHKHGCCVLQKLLSVCTLQQIFKISVKIIQYLPSLINDQFGNYIIQFLFDIKELDFYLLGETFNKLSQKLCQLSCLKFSSNVVEKYIKKLFSIVTNYASKLTSGNLNSSEKIDDGEDVVNASMDILLVIADIFMANITALIRDNYGNYALQTLLDVKNYAIILEFPKSQSAYAYPRLTSFSQEFAAKISSLIVTTKELLPSIKNTSYAKKIKLKVRAYTELTGMTFDDLSPMKKKSNEPFRQQNRHHSRNFSLPSNAYLNRSMHQGPGSTQYQRNASFNDNNGSTGYQHKKKNSIPQQLPMPSYQQSPQMTMPIQQEYMMQPQQHVPLQNQQPRDPYMSNPAIQQPLLMNSNLHYPSNNVANVPSPVYIDSQYPAPQSHNGMLYGFPTQSQPGLTSSMSQTSFVSLPGSLNGSNVMSLSESQANTPPNGMLPPSQSNIMQHNRNGSFPMFGDNSSYFG